MVLLGNRADAAGDHFVPGKDLNIRMLFMHSHSNHVGLVHISTVVA